jgi:hypothetical protein
MSKTIIESEIVEINNSAENVFNYLSDFNNFGTLMPQQVTNWQSTTEDCSFTINGMATIGMKIVDKTNPTKISISSNGKVPFEFMLYILLTPTDGNNCSGQLVFDAELNPMIKMMVEKPLGNFFNMLAQKMKDIK